MILTAVAGGLLILVAFLALRPLLVSLSQGEERRRETAPLPPGWVKLLDDSVPAARHLNDEQRVRLLRASRQLIQTRHWEGCGGLLLTEEMELVIAAQACLLILGIPGEPFPRIREVLVYPGTFVPRKAFVIGSAGRPPHAHVPLLGETWSDGSMVLAWDDVMASAANPTDGHNVVLHEFAHELDFERHLTPSLGEGMTPQVSDADTWQRVLQTSFERLCDKLESHAPTVFGDYAGTQIAEFFAEATAAFFERPRDVAREDPELYGQLRALYRQDPASATAA